MRRFVEHRLELENPVVAVDPAQKLVTTADGQPWLHSQGIWSRGRLGGWLYEIGNMDHSCMQGVEFVDHVLGGEPERTARRRSRRRRSSRPTSRGSSGCRPRAAPELLEIVARAERVLVSDVVLTSR